MKFPPGVGEGRDESCGHRIWRARHDDGNGKARLLQPGQYRTWRHDHVHVESGELGRNGRDAVQHVLD